MNDIDKKIEELITKANSAQDLGDFKAMKEYDKELEYLRRIKDELLNEANNKKGTRKSR